MSFEILRNLARQPELLAFVLGPKDEPLQGIRGVIMVRPGAYDCHDHLVNLGKDVAALQVSDVYLLRQDGWIPFIHDSNHALIGALLLRLQSEHVNGGQISLASMFTKGIGHEPGETKWTVHYGFTDDAQQVSHDNLCEVLVVAFLDLLRRENENPPQHAAAEGRDGRML